MKLKEAVKIARKQIAEGKTRQETFDTLMASNNLPSVEFATIIQAIPSVQARNKYKTANAILTTFLILTIVFKLITGIFFVMENGLMTLPVLLLLPLLNIYLLWGVLNYRPGTHRVVGILAIIGILRSLQHVIGQPFDPLLLLDFSIAAGLIVLGFYLHNKLHPVYRTVRESYQNSEGHELVRNAIKFDE
jgi:hypothetical protein